MIKKIIVFLSLIIGVSVFMSACSSSTSESSSKPEKDSKEVIRVGATTTGAPFTYLNTETNEIDGLMIDIAKRVAEETGAEIEVIETQFASLIPAVDSDRIDMISAGMLTTDERKEIIDFTIPVYQYGEGLVVPKSQTDITSLEDLKGKTVGVQEGTIFYTGLQEYKDIKVKGYKSIADMLMELKNGRIDAFLGDYPIVKHMLQENTDFDVTVVEDYEPQWVGDVSLGVAKGSEDFLNELNDAIDSIKENGELDKIIKKRGL